MSEKSNHLLELVMFDIAYVISNCDYEYSSDEKKYLDIILDRYDDDDKEDCTKVTIGSASGDDVVEIILNGGSHRVGHHDQLLAGVLKSFIEIAGLLHGSAFVIFAVDDFLDGRIVESLGLFRIYFFNRC